MNAAVQDTIEREIVVKAPQARVYSAISDPDQITGWFPDAVEGTFHVGEQPILDFGEDGKARIYVVAARPNDYFAYRWVPGGGEVVDNVLAVPNTLVEFHIQDANGATKVTMKESGFASLPADVAEAKFKDNVGGWDYMMDRLSKLLSQE